MTSEVDAVKRRARWQYRWFVVGWYAPMLGIAVAVGLWADRPLPLALIMFALLEVATLLFSLLQDDWADDFRGDREVFVRGTLINAAVVLVTVITAAL
jgi:hypothetical protein